MNSSESIDDIGALEIIKKSKELLDAGAITQEEFEEIKRIYLMPFSDENDETQKIKQVQKDPQYSFDYASDNFSMIARDKTHEEVMVEKQGLKTCPHCGKKILKNAVRCKYCKTNLKEYNQNHYKRNENEQKPYVSSKPNNHSEMVFEDCKTNLNEDYSIQSWKSLFNPNNKDVKKSNPKIPNKSESKDNNNNIKTEINSCEKSSNDINFSNIKNIKHENISDESNGEIEPWYYTVSPQYPIKTKPKQKKVKTKVSKLSTKPSKTEHKPKIDSKPKYQNYKLQVNKLQSNFKMKEKNTRDLIEKCFPSPQMTNTKFNQLVDECLKIFSHKMKSIMIIIGSSNDYSPKLENKIKSDIDALKQIINKLDSLHDELLIQMSESDDDDFENLLEEMDQIITSVKEYEFDNK